MVFVDMVIKISATIPTDSPKKNSASTPSPACSSSKIVGLIPFSKIYII